MKRPETFLEVLAVNRSKKKGTVKSPEPFIRLLATGVEGDAHSGPWNRMVSLLGRESIEKFEAASGRKVIPGEFAENITTSGLELWKTRPLDRFRSDEVELEVTQIGKECHGSSCAIFKEVGDCVMPKEGIFARVVRPGKLKPGDRLEYLPKVFSVHVITLSDRASSGLYEDRSGPALVEGCHSFFQKTGLQAECHYTLLPDEPRQLEPLLLKLKGEKTDVVFTTGGTGIGPRDFTPEVVGNLLDREIPGIMEMIRMRFGQEKPGALLSRGVAGVMGQSLIYTLPGSPRAVNDYFSEISKNLLHAIYMVHSIDHHE